MASRSLFLVLVAAGSRYALPCADVITVIPSVRLRPIDLAPPWVAGVFSFRGQITPVIDLDRLLGDHEAPPRLCRRIVLLRLPQRTLGLRAGEITEVTELDEHGSLDTIALPNAPFLRSLHRDSRGILQRVEVSQLLPQSVRDVILGGG